MAFIFGPTKTEKVVERKKDKEKKEGGLKKRLRIRERVRKTKRLKSGSDRAERIRGRKREREIVSKTCKIEKNIFPCLGR